MSFTFVLNASLSPDGQYVVNGQLPSATPRSEQERREKTTILPVGTSVLAPGHTVRLLGK